MDNKKQQMIDALQSICEEMGWVIGIPAEEGSEEQVPGLLIGTEEFVYSIVAAMRGEYEAFSKNMADDGMKELPVPKKKVTFH